MLREDAKLITEYAIRVVLPDAAGATGTNVNDVAVLLTGG